MARVSDIDVQKNLLAAYGGLPRRDRSPERRREPRDRSRSRSPRRFGREEEQEEEQEEVKARTMVQHVLAGASSSSSSAPGKTRAIAGLPMKHIPPLNREVIKALARKLHNTLGGSFVPEADDAFSITAEGKMTIRWHCLAVSAVLRSIESCLTSAHEDLVCTFYDLSGTTLTAHLKMFSSTIKTPSITPLPVTLYPPARDCCTVDRRDLSVNYQEQALPYVKQKLAEKGMTMKPVWEQELAWIVAHVAVQITRAGIKDSSVILDLDPGRRPRIVCEPIHVVTQDFMRRILKDLVRVDPIVYPGTSKIALDFLSPL